MRHRKSRLQLNRFTSWRKATLKSLLRGLILNQSIKTTRIKAKAAGPLIDKLISLGKEDTLAARRQAFKILGEHHLVSLLFNDIAKRFNNRTSGYSRILNLGFRRGDNAQMALLELTEIKKKEAKKVKEKKEAKPQEEKKAGPEVRVTEEKPPISKKPSQNFLGGLKRIFKKERDAL